MQHFIPGSLQDGINRNEPVRIVWECFNRGTNPVNAGEVMAFNEDNANATYIGIDPVNTDTYKYKHLLTPTFANIIGACGMALETVAAGKAGRFLMYGFTDILKGSSVSGNILAGDEISLENSATGSGGTVNVISGSSGASVYARPKTGTNGMDAYTVALRCFGKFLIGDTSAPTAVSARTALFNGFGYWVGYGA